MRVSNSASKAVASLIALVLLSAACAPTSQPAATTAPAAKPAEAPKPAEASKPAAAPAKPAEAAKPLQLQKLKVGVNALSNSMLPYWVAKEAGVFEKHGLDVEFISMQTSTQLAPALISGELGIANTASAGQVNAGLKGADTVMISAHQPFLRFFIYAKPEIKSMADLKGKKIGTTRPGGGLDLSIRLAIERAGMVAGRDVAIIPLGTVQNILAGVLTGNVEAGAVSPPTDKEAEAKGLKLIVDTLEWKFEYVQGGVGTTRSWMQKNPELARSFMKAYIEGQSLVHKDRELAITVLGKYLDVADRKVLGESYDLEIPSWRFPPFATPAGAKSVLDQVADEDPTAKTADPAKFIDATIIKELEDSGFIKSLGVPYVNWP